MTHRDFRLSLAPPIGLEPILSSGNNRASDQSDCGGTMDLSNVTGRTACPVAGCDRTS